MNSTPTRAESTGPEPLNTFDARTLPNSKIPDMNDINKVKPFDTKIDLAGVASKADLQRDKKHIRPTSDGPIRNSGAGSKPSKQAQELPKEIWVDYNEALQRSVDGIRYGRIPDEVWNKAHPKYSFVVGSPPQKDKDWLYKKWLEGHGFY